MLPSSWSLRACAPAPACSSTHRYRRRSVRAGAAFAGSRKRVCCPFREQLGKQSHKSNREANERERRFHMQRWFILLVAASLSACTSTGDIRRDGEKKREV